MNPLNIPLPPFNMKDFEKGEQIVAPKLFDEMVHILMPPPPQSPAYTPIVLTDGRIKELQEMGEKLEYVKVTPAMERDGTPSVHIRDFVFTDYIKAAHFLQRIAATEYPHDSTYIG